MTNAPRFPATRAALAALLAVVAGCSGGAREQGAAAHADEKVLNVDNWSDYIQPSVIADFERETGIKVNYDVFDSNEILETKLLTGHTNYDVVVPSGAFLERQLQADIYRKLDKSLLPNLKNVDPDVARDTALYDPGNQYAVDYMWITSGVGYNVASIRQRMPDAPVDSWRMLFDPAVVAKFQDCGVSMASSSPMPASSPSLESHRPSAAPPTPGAPESPLFRRAGAPCCSTRSRSTRTCRSACWAASRGFG